jgi:hypothetical protein
MKDELVADFGIASPRVRAAAFVILILTALSTPRCGATVHHSDGSVASVQALHKAAKDGDTITLPAGTFSWTSRLDITKGITLQGATTITGAGTGNPKITDATIIKDDTPRNQTTGGIIKINILPSQSFRLTGFTFQPGAATTFSGAPGAITILGSYSSPVTSLRVDHCHFAQLYQRVFAINGWVYGVSDHNVIDTRRNNSGFMVEANTYGGTSQINGNGAWADYPWYGTEKFWFIEDNTIIGSGAGALDSYRGGRWVARYNYFKNTHPSGHGTEGGPRRGQRANEVYNNTFESTVSGGTKAGMRSGTALFHDNVFIGVRPTNDHCYTLSNYRISTVRSGDPVWGRADGTSVWDANATRADGTFHEGEAPFVFDSGTDTDSVNSEGVIHDSTKNWTPNQWAGYSVTNLTCGGCGGRPGSMGTYIISNTSNTITYRYEAITHGGRHMLFNAGDHYAIHKLLIMMDACGRGKTDQIIGNRPVLQATGQPGYPHMAQEPLYGWNNVYNPGGISLNIASAPSPVSKENIDYFNLGTGFSSTPSAVSNRYTAALNGVDYVGPFVYPHPLVTGAATPTPSATPRSQQHLQKKKEKKQNAKKKKRRPKNRRIDMAERLAPCRLRLLSEERVFAHNRGNEGIVFRPRFLFCALSSGIPIKLLWASTDHANRMLALPGQSDPLGEQPFQSDCT